MSQLDSHGFKLLSVLSLLFCQVRQTNPPAPDTLKTSDCLILTHTVCSTWNAFPCISTSSNLFVLPGWAQGLPPPLPGRLPDCLMVIATFSKSVWYLICSVFPLANIGWAPTMCQALVWWLGNQISLVSIPLGVHYLIWRHTEHIITQMTIPSYRLKSAMQGNKGNERFKKRDLFVSRALEGPWGKDM